MGIQGKAPSQRVNKRSLVAIGLLIVWAGVLVATHLFDPAGQTPPSQFDYDDGAVPPRADERALATVQAVALVTTLPVTVLALCIAASALRTWREQVSATIAMVLTSIAAMAGIAFAWIGVGTFVFFT
ncbi:hypothetical protein [Curtobacterium sp. UCD-KPL2560]|uniref:hypothetical protein n=1 Tax=Curtobacterium sp. UCD-KPL2560 TaxID=1885315 RepID=UPI0008253B63|nr:hypothetical protein [Curtobacterium sp. UCD-KPL2560]